MEATNFHHCLQLANYKDKLVRLLADMENLRDRTNRQAEQARSFAIQVCLTVLCLQHKQGHIKLELMFVNI